VHSGLVGVIRDAFAMCAPPPEMTVSQWADEHRIISQGTSPEPGKWRTDRVPYMRGIMDAYNDPTVREINVKKATQVAYTEILLNIVGYNIDINPGPMLWLLPNETQVDEISKQRLAPMLRDTSRVAKKVRPPRSRDSSNTIATKEFLGGRISLVSSNSPADLASKPIRDVIEDECDRFAASAGVEGDPSTLAGERQAWFWNAKTIRGSSPTVKGRSKIDGAYQASDKRMLFVPCPYCGERQTLRWEQVKWDKDKDERGKTVAHKPETAAYLCEHCGELWDDADRWKAVAEGEWRATAPFRGIAGFFLPQFYSSVVPLSKMVTRFLTAYGRLPGTFPDPLKQISFTNTVLAETWEEQGSTIDASGLLSRGEPYGPRDLPDGVQFATAGIDVQKNRIEIQVVGWGVAEECWAIDYHVVAGDPTQPRTWEDVDRLLLALYATRSGRPVRIFAACIDASDTTYGHQVHEFCRVRFGRRVFAIKGDDGPRPIFPRRPSRTKTGHNIYIVGTDTAKDTIANRLLVQRRDDGPDAAQPGYVHFPVADVVAGKWDQAYFEQLTSEKQVTRYREGRPYRVWLPIRSGIRNEALDTFVYALAARQAVPVSLSRPLPSVSSDADAVAAQEVMPASVSPTPAVTPVRPRSATTPSRMERLALMQRR
jgi:phage terminase large subunit GpA-like protein